MARAGNNWLSGLCEVSQGQCLGLVCHPESLAPLDLPRRGEKLAWPLSWRRLQLLPQPCSQQTKVLSFSTQGLACMLPWIRKLL